MNTQTSNKNCGSRVLFSVFIFFLVCLVFRFQLLVLRFVLLFSFCLCFRFRYFVWFRCVVCICRFKGFQISFYGFQMVSSILFVTFCFMCFRFVVFRFRCMLFSFSVWCSLFVWCSCCHVSFFGGSTFRFGVSLCLFL